MAERLAAAHAQINRLSAALEERDHTIALQARTIRDLEAALEEAVRGPAGGSRASRASTSGLTSA